MTLTQDLTFTKTLTKGMYRVHCFNRYLGEVNRSGKKWAAKARSHGYTGGRKWSGPYTTRNSAGEVLRETERKWIACFGIGHNKESSE